MFQYLATLPRGKAILWCYLLWWSVIISHHFHADIRLWSSSLGLSLIIGAALLINAGGDGKNRLDRWQTFRFFLIPFCVSSFAASIRGEGFVLVFPPSLRETALAVAVCVAFLLAMVIARASAKRR